MSDLLLRRPFVNRLGIRPGNPSVLEIIHQVCDRLNVSKEAVLARDAPNKGLAREIKQARAEIIRRAVAAGKSVSVIGKAIGRHRSAARDWLRAA